MEPKAHAVQNCADKSLITRSFDWGPIETLMICSNAVVGMCAERHSDDGENTGSMSRDMPLHCRRQSCKHYRVSVCNGWEASSCAFRPRVKGGTLLAQMPTVTA